MRSRSGVAYRGNCRPDQIWRGTFETPLRAQYETSRLAGVAAVPCNQAGTLCTLAPSFEIPLHTCASTLFTRWAGQDYMLQARTCGISIARLYKYIRSSGSPRSCFEPAPRDLQVASRLQPAAASIHSSDGLPTRSPLRRKCCVLLSRLILQKGRAQPC